MVKKKPFHISILSFEQPSLNLHLSPSALTCLLAHFTFSIEVSLLF